MMIKERKQESGADLYRKLQKENHELADCNARLLTQVAAATKRLVALEKENANLNATLDLRKMQLDDASEIIKEMQSKVDTLQKENAEQKDQLTKAKELLKQWVELYKPKLEGYPITPIQEQTEQFIKEIEK